MRGKTFLSISLTVLLCILISSAALADLYEDRFMELYNVIKDPRSGYFSAEGIPYHSVETMIVEAPDYGHVTTSEAFSYYIWLEAMYGKFSGDWSKLYTAWSTMEEYMIPSLQTGLNNYDPNSPATYAPEFETPDQYPAPLDFNVPVGRDPLHYELRATYGTDEIYGMHWLLDVDNWYGFGGENSTDPVFINTFQRGPEESTWETVPHPSIEEFKYGGPNGFLDLFTGDEQYSRQWRYTNAPDADARAIQAMYWADKWATDQGVNLNDLVAKASKMGDYLRYSFFDKYFKEIGCQDINASGNGYNSAHYLLSWYYAWGGGIGASWSWKIGCSHNHSGYQNPMAAYVLSEVPRFRPLSPNASSDWAQSLERQLEFYMWLQSAEGAIAGGASNSYNGRYERYPSGASTFYGMVYEEHPVYHDPGSNRWFGFQCWTMQRVAEYYLETGNQIAANLLDKWVDWAVSEVQLPADGSFAIPANLIWQGQPETWIPGSTSWNNPSLHVRVESYSQDLGVTGSLCNTLITYAAAKREHASFDQRAQRALDTARELLDRVWQYRDDKGISVPEEREDYSRFFDEIPIPAGWRGQMPNGDIIEPGVTFLGIRSKYLNDPDYEKIRTAYERNEAPVMRYHRFWAQCDIALALGKMAMYFPEDGQDITKGDVNGDGSVNSLDYILVRRYLLGIINEFPYPDGFEAADLNNDGRVNSLDYMLLRDLIQ